MNEYQYIINKPVMIEIERRHGHWAWRVEVGNMKNRGKQLTELEALQAALRCAVVLQYYDQKGLPFNPGI